MSYNKSLELRITELSASLERMEIKKMIGGIGFFINGNMFCGIHKNYLILRLSRGDAINSRRELVNSRRLI